MPDIHKHKVNAAKFDYEYLGKSPVQIAETYGFPLVSLNEEISLKEWERKLAPTPLPDTKDMQVFADQLEKMTRSKLSIISLFRQIDNQSLYAELEKAILERCLDAAASLSPDDDRMTAKLVNITKTLVSIQERNPIQLADTLNNTLANASAGVVVNIANQIQ